MTTKRTIRGIRDSIPGGYVLGRIGGLGSGPPSLIKFTPNSQGGVGGGGKSRADPTIVHSNASTNFTVGNTSDAYPIGTVTSGTITPDPALGNLQTITNNGAFTLAAPTASHDYTIIIAMTAGASAGAVTITGFKRVTGDPLTAGVGDELMLSLYNVGGIKWLNVVAMQVGHRYWGVRPTANSGNATYVGIGNIEMATSVFGAAMAMTSGNVFATTHFSGFGPEQAITDDSVASHNHWSASKTGGNPIWWYDFGSGIIIKRVSITGPSTTTSWSESVSAFDIVYSDDASTWTTSWSDTLTTAAGTSDAREFTHSFDPSASLTHSGSPWDSHTYWKVSGHYKTYEAFGELEFRATTGGSNQASGGTPTATSEYNPSYSPDKAFDGNTATEWCSSGASDGEWITYEFSAAVLVGEIAGTASTVSPADTAEHMFVYFSDDGTNWTRAWKTADVPSWTGGQTIAFTDPLYI